MTHDRWRPLGKLLVEKNLITEAQLRAALDDQTRSGRPLGEIVVRSGALTVEQLASVLLEQCRVDPLTQEGFGSGLREKLARTSVIARPEAIRVVVEQDEPEEPETTPISVPEPRRRFRRRRDRKAIARLEALVREFEDEHRELVDNLGALRRLLRDEAA